MAGFDGDAHELVNRKLVPEAQKDSRQLIEVLNDLSKKDNNLSKVVDNIPKEVLEFRDYFRSGQRGGPSSDKLLLLWRTQGCIRLEGNV